MFNEKSLYEDIVKTWGENGAHADIYRMLCTRAGVTLNEKEEPIEDKVKRIHKETNGSKIETIKRVRWETEGLDLIAAKRLVEMYV